MVGSPIERRAYRCGKPKRGTLKDLLKHVKGLKVPGLLLFFMLKPLSFNYFMISRNTTYDRRASLDPRHPSEPSMRFVVAYYGSYIVSYPGHIRAQRIPHHEES